MYVVSKFFNGRKNQASCRMLPSMSALIEIVGESLPAKPVPAVYSTG
ncbi:hypothetical protein EYZ11_004703 [Aspergillus tanneri]|uniref:Uncharacterized protein n=1 Tax=Aspergillus tanneri TaxID=1220188 RepID=A0A4S3JK44_9EURO|nr:hypothetical protein EYZ11_004703 [Aspergillus tanneri]